MSQFVEFNRFPELFQDQKTKKSERSLQHDAKKWFEELYGAQFGTTSTNNDKFAWHFSAGLLMFSLPHVGFYYYKHIIKLIHFYHWKENSFNEGYKYYKRYNPQRDIHSEDNPFSNSNFYNRDAWHWGFIIRLQEEESKFRLSRLTKYKQ